jgi:hypothetical protein
LACVTSKTLIGRKKGGVLSAAPQHLPQAYGRDPSRRAEPYLIIWWEGRACFPIETVLVRAIGDDRDHDLSAGDIAGV